MSNSARDKFIIMESKIFIDINYSSREPQIVIHAKDSDDPRDKLVSMLTGQAMPGIRDGFCRIERYANEGMIVITPVSPVDMIKFIPQIAETAETCKVIDTSDVPQQYREILQSELARVLATPDRPQSSLLPLFEQLCRPIMPEKPSQG